MVMQEEAALGQIDGEPRPLGRWRAAVAFLHLVLFSIIPYRALFRTDSWVGPNLFHHHTWFSEFAFASYWRPATPGYLWLGTTHLVNLILRADDPRIGAVLATSVFYAIFGLALFEVFRIALGSSTQRMLALAAVFSVMLAVAESPSALFGWEGYTSGSLFLPLYLPYAPTTIGSLGIGVFLCLQLGKYMDDESASTPTWQIPLLIFAATVAKPTIVPLLLCAVLLEMAFRYSFGRPGRRSAKELVISVVLPSIVSLAPVLLVTVYKVQYPREGFDDRGGWTLNPLQEMRDLNALTVFFWSAVAFPLVALLLTRRRLLQSSVVRLLIIGSLVGVALAMLLKRSGTSDWEGDLLQLPESAIALLVVFVAARMVELRRQGRLSNFEAGAGAALFLPYLVAGLMSWSCHVGLGCPAL